MLSDLVASSESPVCSSGLCCALRGRPPPSASMHTIRLGSIQITMSALRLDHRIARTEPLPLGSERAWELEFYMAVAASACDCPGMFSHVWMPGFGEKGLISELGQTQDWADGNRDAMGKPRSRA